MTNIVVSRVKPQLVRRRSVVNTQQTVRVVVNPAALRPQTAALREIQRSKQPLTTPRTVAAPRPARPVASVVVQKRNAKRLPKKTKGVTYVSPDVDQGSITKATNLKARGRGRLLIIVGNGPSLSEAALDKLKNQNNIDTMTINTPDQRLWPTTYWTFFDVPVLRRHETLWSTYAGLIFNSTSIKKLKQNSVQFKSLGGHGFSRDLTVGLHIGRSSVYAAMQIAYWMEYEHVYLFGVDMNPDGLNGKLHFYGTNPDVKPEVRRERFAKEAEYYDRGAEILTPPERARYTFCSAYLHWPFADKFNKIDHKTAVDTILEHAKRI